MPLQDQVTSLELSKRFKELGVPQNSLFYWRLAYSTSESFDKGVSLGKKGEFGDYRIEYYPKPRYTTADIKWNEADLSRLYETELSAFTVAELGKIIGPGLRSRINMSGNIVVTHTLFEFGFGDDTEANARAKMLIYLLEQKLITL